MEDDNGMVLVPAQGWVAGRDSFMARAAAVAKIETDSDLEVAGALDTEAKRIVRELEAARKGVTSKLDAVKKRIMAQERELVADVVAEEARLARLASDYALAQQRKREAEERAIREMEHAAAEEAAAAMDADPFAAEADEPAAPKLVPATAKPTTSSNTFVKTYDFEVVRPDAVPREFCSPDEKKIRAFIQYQKSLGNDPEQLQIAGVAIHAKMSIRAK